MAKNITSSIARELLSEHARLVGTAALGALRCRDERNEWTDYAEDDFSHVFKVEGAAHGTANKLAEFWYDLLRYADQHPAFPEWYPISVGRWTARFTVRIVGIRRTEPSLLDRHIFIELAERNGLRYTKRYDWVVTDEGGREALRKKGAL